MSTRTAGAGSSLPGGAAALLAPPGRVRVVPLGTELTPSPQPGRVLADLRIEQPYVVWVGTLEPRKNVERVIRGFVEAVTSGPRDERGLKLYQMSAGRPSLESVFLEVMGDDQRPG